jgi:hypothetical protein
MSNRRTFVAAAGSGALLGPFMATPGQACTATARRAGGSPTQAAFQALQGQDFRLRHGLRAGGTLRLVSVQERGGSARLEQFSLLMRSEAGAALPSGLYRIEHPASGRFAMRLEPSGHDAQGALYRADFSLLV